MDKSEKLSLDMAIVALNLASEKFADLGYDLIVKIEKKDKNDG